MTLLEISKTQSCVRLRAAVCEYREETVSSGNPSPARSLRLIILMPSSRASQQDTCWSDQSPLGAVPSLV